jgi:hypothetical protein
LFCVIEVAPAVQRQIADQKQASNKIDSGHHASKDLCQRFVQAFDQIHSSLQELIIR